MIDQLQICELNCGYARQFVLRDITLSGLPPGQLVALIGPNAAGKSTLLKAIAGLLPSQGTIRLGSTDLAALHSEQRLQHIGYLPQTLPSASSLVVYEALLAATRTTRMHVANAAAAVDTVLAELGLGDLAFRRFDQLSGGQRQMVGLAQVLVREPRIMLLDEPTSALDLRWQLKVLTTVRERADRLKTTTLFAIHDLNLALRFCDQVIVLNNGNLLASGPPAKVLDPELLYQTYGVDTRIERCSQGHLLVLADPPRATTSTPLSKPEETQHAVACR